MPPSFVYPPDSPALSSPLPEAPVNPKFLLGFVLCSSFALAQNTVEQQMQHRIAASGGASEAKPTKITPSNASAPLNCSNQPTLRRTA